MVDVCVEQNASGDGRLAKAFAGMEFRVRFDLRAEVGRGSEQKPGMGVGADGDLGLGAGLSKELSGSENAAVGAGAVPLWERSSSGRAENLDLHSGSVAAAGEISVLGKILFGGIPPSPPVYWNHWVRGKTQSNLRPAITCGQNLCNKGVKHAVRGSKSAMSSMTLCGIGVKVM